LGRHAQDRSARPQIVFLPLVVRYRGRAERRHGVFAMDQRARGDGELIELVDHALPFGGVAQDADALVAGWMLGGFDPVPPDLSFEPRWCLRVVGQLLVIGLLADRKRQLEAEVRDPLIHATMSSRWLPGR
jgi:hypothetical protein